MSDFDFDFEVELELDEEKGEEVVTVTATAYFYPGDPECPPSGGDCEIEAVVRSNGEDVLSSLDPRTVEWLARDAQKHASAIDADDKSSVFSSRL